MRPQRLVVLLVFLLVAAGAVLWLTLQPAQPDFEGAEHSNLPGRQRAGKSSPQDQRADNSGKQPGDRREQPETRRPGDTTPVPETGEWVISGSLKVDAAAGANPLAHFLPGDRTVVVRAYRGPRAPEHCSEFHIVLQNDWSFRQECAPEDLELEPGESPASLLWYVDHEPEDGGFSEPSDADAEIEGWHEPTGAILVQPRVSGREINLGDVVLTLDSMFPNSFIVVGRLVHSSGRTLCNTGNHALTTSDTAGEYSDWLSIGTDEHGRFLAVLYASNEGALFDIATLVWTLVLRADWDSLEGRVQLPQPRIAGRLLDFGDISLRGSLLDVTVEMDPAPKLELRADGTLAIDERGNYDGESPSLYLLCGSLELYEAVPPSPHKVTMWVPEGRYHWRIYEFSDELVYLPASGMLDVPDNAVTSLRVSLKVAATVPVRVLLPDGTPATEAWLEWAFVMPGADEYSGNLSGPQFRVPVIESSETTVTAYLDGYSGATGKTKPGDTELVLQVEEKAPPDTGIEVRLPARPQGVQPDGAFRLRLWIKGGVGQSDQWVNLLVEGPGVLRIATKPGAATVQLNGGCDWGYPAIISGPVACTVREGEFTVVELPAILPPPWAIRAEKLHCTVRAGEQPVEIDAEFLGADGTDFGDASYSDGMDTECGALPAHLQDGDQKIAVQVSPPTAEARSAKLLLELPPRIEVRVKRRGVEVTNFRAEVWGQGDGMKRISQCAGSTGTGAVSLWFPPGKATLTVELENFGHTQEVIVRRGEVTRVDVDLGHVRVEFVNPAEGEGGTQDLPRLRIFTIRDDGTLDPEMYDTIWGPEVRMLPPSRYRMIPPASAGAASAFDVDLREGGDRVVVLPAVNTELVSVRLNFPMEFADAPNHYLELQLLPLTDPEQLRMSPEFADQGDWLESRFVPNGLLVQGVPKGVEVCLIGYFTSYEGENERGLILKPIRLRVQQDGETVAAEWKKAVRLHEEWQWLDVRYLSLIEGCALPFYDGAAGALPGTHEVGFYANDKLVHREWVTFGGDGEMCISAGLRAALVEKELVEAEVPDED